MSDSEVIADLPMQQQEKEQEPKIEQIQPEEPTTQAELSDASEVNVAIDLAQLLLSNVNIPTYNLTSSQIIWINEFIKSSPSSFATITNDIKNITSTGKIGLSQIPQIIHLCADIYSSEAIKNGLAHPENIIAFIKFTLDVILESKYLILPDTEKEMILILVDTSLHLLSMKLPTVEAEIVECESNPCCIQFMNFFRFK